MENRHRLIGKCHYSSGETSCDYLEAKITAQIDRLNTRVIKGQTDKQPPHVSFFPALPLRLISNQCHPFSVFDGLNFKPIKQMLEREAGIKSTKERVTVK